MLDPGIGKGPFYATAGFVGHLDNHLVSGSPTNHVEQSNVKWSFLELNEISPAYLVEA